MAWDTVPWFVGGGAQHSPEVARLLGYVAFNGNEGILGPLDLRVKALDTPGGSVNVLPGACAILSRATGGSYQAYAGRLPSQDTVAISPTDSTGGRSDLIVARVEDPFMAGEPWADPTDPTTGPYIFTRVIPNVPPTTKTVTELNLGYSAIPLARIDIPASTATITDSMIVDLRKVANPRSERGLIAEGWHNTQLDDLTNSSYATYPTQAQYSIDIPSWAVQFKCTVTWAQIQNVTSNPTYGSIRWNLGGQVSEDVTFDSVPGAGSYRTNFICADRISIPASMRGTTQTLKLEGQRTSGTGYMEMDGGSAVIIDYEFQEEASVS